MTNNNSNWAPFLTNSCKAKRTDQLILTWPYHSSINVRYNTSTRVKWNLLINGNALVSNASKDLWKHQDPVVQKTVEVLLVWNSLTLWFKSSKLWSKKSQDFNGVWTRDLAIPVRRSNQLSCEATDVGSWSFVSSNEPVKNGCKVIYEMFHILNCGFENQIYDSNLTENKFQNQTNIFLGL